MVAHRIVVYCSLPEEKAVTAPGEALIQLDQLAVSGGVRADLEEFVSRLIDFGGEQLVSVIAFGGAADLNLLVVYSDLNIVDLDMVAGRARRWLKKRGFAPRFLSVRDLVALSQIELLEMRDAHAVLYGDDVLAGLEIRPEEMRWEVAHEVKRMRIGVKQEFWRAAGDGKLMRPILIERFSSLIQLMQALLFLENRPAVARERDVIDAAVRELGTLRTGKLRSGELVRVFDDLLELIRAVDARVDGLR